MPARVPVEETAGPAVREDERYTPAGCRTLVYEVDAIPNEVLESVEPPFPGTPVELIRPVGHEALQPVQLGALLPAYAGYLVRPSRMAQPCPQIVEHLIRDMNSKRFHDNKPLLAIASNEPDAQAISCRVAAIIGDKQAWGAAARFNSVTTQAKSCPFLRTIMSICGLSRPDHGLFGSQLPVKMVALKN